MTYPTTQGFGAPDDFDADGYGPWGFGDAPPGEFDGSPYTPEIVAVAEQIIYILTIGGATLPTQVRLYAYQDSGGVLLGTTDDEPGDTFLIMMQRLIADAGDDASMDWTLAVTALEPGDYTAPSDWGVRVTATAKVAGLAPVGWWGVSATSSFGGISIYGPTTDPPYPAGHFIGQGYAPSTYPPCVAGVEGVPEGIGTPWDGSPPGPGFGDDYPGSETFTAVLLLPEGAESAYPNDGGEILRILGDWSLLLSTTGPYRVHVVNTDTSVAYPQAPDLGCYSGKPGDGTACTTDQAQRRLQFVLPRCPVGTYDVQVAYGPDYGSIFTLPLLLRVVRYGQNAHQWHIRQGLPPKYSAGGRGAARQPLQTDTGAAAQLGLLEAVTRALGEEMQVLAGRPMTRLTATLAHNDTSASVETTLGFAAVGSFWCRGRRYTYTSKTDTSFAGIEPDHTDGQDIGAGADVTCDAAAVLPD